MNDFSNVKRIGFDLDQTLYPKSEEIDKAIQGHIHGSLAKFLTEKHGREYTKEEAKELFDQHYATLESGSKVLIELGMGKEQAKATVQDALNNSDITPFIIKDEAVIQLLKDLKTKYGSVDLITSSNRALALKKLEKLEINPDMFSVFLTAEDDKASGAAFKTWLDLHIEKDPSLTPDNFLYIGDRKSADVERPGQHGIKGVLVNVKQKKPELGFPQFHKVVDLRRELL